jgi:hypothetical protein
MSLLPQTIPPQTEPFGEVEIDSQTGKPTGRITVGVNWYLFLYNISKQVLTAPGAAPVPIAPANTITLTDIDVTTADEIPDRRQIENLNVMVHGLLDAMADPGPVGPAGAMGAVGMDGDTGEDGMLGPPGLPGSQGIVGPAGIGIPGMDGDSGEDAMGFPGQPGPAGSTGATGPAGTIGFGLDGEDGSDGSAIPGIPGPQGPAGSIGPPGLSTFVVFQQGDDGEDGSIGPPGIAGSGSGSGVTKGFAVVDFGTGALDASVAVTGQTGFTAGTNIVAAFMQSTATANNLADDAAWDNFSVQVRNQISGAGFTILVKCGVGLANGQYNVGWLWG